MAMNAALAQNNATGGSADAYITEKANSQSAIDDVTAKKRKLTRDERSRMMTTVPSRNTRVAVASGSATNARNV